MGEVGVGSKCKDMKKVILTITIILASICLYAQPVPPPSQNGQNGNQPGGGAPLDGGIGFLLLMSVAYGTKKTIQIINKESQAK